MSARTERFQRKAAESNGKATKPDTKEAEDEEVIKFAPEEEAVRNQQTMCHDGQPILTAEQALLSESNFQKTEANAKFAQSSYTDAIELYNSAISTCPNYLEYEVAVLRSNIAACHLKLEDWKAAVDEATKALDGLDRLQGKGKHAKEDSEGVEGQVKEADEEEADEEIISEGATKAEDVSAKGKRDADVERIRAKALMRRARARSELGVWASLQGAEEGRSQGFVMLL